MKSIVVSNIEKTYGKKKDLVKALQGISFDVDEGELFGIIGPDGSGKTSLFRILTTVLLADKGEAYVNGLDVVKNYRDIRKQVGYMPGRFSLYQDLSVEENLEFFASIFNTSIDENYDLIKDIYLQIEPFKKRRAGQLSGGMKQKLALCCALIHRPAILFLDEPTTGVDAVSRKEFWEMLGKLKAEKITILVSTPYMDEASRCDRVALIQDGKILSVATPASIVAGFGKPLWALRSSDMFPLLQDLKNDTTVDSCYPFGEYHHVVFRQQTGERQILEKYGQKHPQMDVIAVTPGIEDCFMDLMTKQPPKTVTNSNV